MAKTRIAVDCHICGKTIGRKADLARHMKTHATNKEDLMHACPYLDCTYKTLQHSNLATHLNTHSRERPNKCPVDGCNFSTADPGSLTRHRKQMHGYEPKVNSASQPSAVARKAARQKRKFSPYTTSSSSTSSSSSGRSLSPVDPAAGTYLTPCPPLPQLLDLSPPISFLPIDNHTKDGSKNALVAYSTELVPRLQEDARAPTLKPQNDFLLTSGSLTAPEVPTVERPRLPTPEQVDLHVTGIPRTVSETVSDEISDAAFEEFLAQFDDWNAEAAPAHAAAPLPASVVQYSIGNTLPRPSAALPTLVPRYTNDNTLLCPPAALPPPVAQYTTFLPTPPFLPSPVARYAVNNTLLPTLPSHTPYEPRGYPAEVASFQARCFEFHSLVASDTGIYSDPVDFFTTPAATTGLPIRRFY